MMLLQHYAGQLNLFKAYYPFIYINYLFCPPAGKRQLSGRCAKRSCRFPAPSSRIVYYAPREEKTWTVHSSCELTPEPKGWPILFPWYVYYFSPYPGRKHHIPVSEQGGNVALSARVW